MVWVKTVRSVRRGSVGAGRDRRQDRSANTALHGGLEAGSRARAAAFSRCHARGACRSRIPVGGTCQGAALDPATGAVVAQRDADLVGGEGAILVVPAVPRAVRGGHVELHQMDVLANGSCGCGPGNRPAPTFWAVRWCGELDAFADRARKKNGSSLSAECAARFCGPTLLVDGRPCAEDIDARLRVVPAGGCDDHVRARRDLVAAKAGQVGIGRIGAPASGSVGTAMARPGGCRRDRRRRAGRGGLRSRQRRRGDRSGAGRAGGIGGGRGWIGGGPGG